MHKGQGQSGDGDGMGADACARHGLHGHESRLGEIRKRTLYNRSDTPKIQYFFAAIVVKTNVC